MSFKLQRVILSTCFVAYLNETNGAIRLAKCAFVLNVEIVFLYATLVFGKQNFSITGTKIHFNIPTKLICLLQLVNFYLKERNYIFIEQLES